MATSDDRAAPIRSPFTTTSDVLRSLNKALSCLEGESNNDADGAIVRPRFELQRRLPHENAGTRRATAAEIKAADLESKLTQAGDYVATLPSWEEKLQWAAQQRQYGNELFAHHRYEAAIDVYLTCLTVAEQEQATLALFLKVMNNLAQCGLQLGWHHKTIQFCSLALERVAGRIDPDAPADDNAELMCKLYYKRAKANRLKGFYKVSWSDLQSSREWLQRFVPDTAEHGRNSSSLLNALDKEENMLNRAQVQARNNARTQKSALQKALLPSKSCEFSTSQQRHFDSEPTDSVPLRQFSALRATTSDNDYELDDWDDWRRPPPIGGIVARYWYQYAVLAGRVAQKLLDWVGDDDVIDETRDVCHDKLD